MKNYLLFQNKDYKIEIDGKSHYYIDQVMIPYIRLKNSFIKKVMPIIISRMKDIDEINKRELTCWLNSPIFQRNRYASFSSPFNIFEIAQSYIVDNFYFGDNYKDHEKELTNIYNEIIVNDNEKFIPIIFTEKIQEVQGCFLYVKEEEIILMFWTFVDEEDENGNLVEVE